MFSPQQQANFPKNSYPPVSAFLIEFAYSHSGVEILLAGFSCVTSLDTGYITALDMCEVCTEAVHSVEVWTRVTLQLWTCVKYVPKQSIP